MAVAYLTPLFAFHSGDDSKAEVQILHLFIYLHMYYFEGIMKTKLKLSWISTGRLRFRKITIPLKCRSII